MPRPEVCIVTANLGGYDDFQPQAEQDIPVEWVAVSDRETACPGPWNLSVVPSNGKHPNLAAKAHKMLPSLSHRYTIWIDANIQVQSPSFAREALECINDGVAVHAHPFRDCIYQEAVESILTPKYDALPIAEQVRHYHRADKWPPNAGLYACGVIAWDRRHPTGKRFGPLWLEECERWGFQDQLSFPVVCRRLEVQPGVFPHPQYESPWFTLYRHLR